MTRKTKTVRGRVVDVVETDDGEKLVCPYGCDGGPFHPKGLPNHMKTFCPNRPEEDGGQPDGGTEPEPDEPDSDDPDGPEVVCPNCGTADTDSDDSPIKNIRPREAKKLVKSTLQDAGSWDPEKDELIEESDYLCVSCAWVWV